MYKIAQYTETKNDYIIYNRVHKGVTINGSCENNIKMYIRIMSFVLMNTLL
jgi:hypothetical protein